MPSPIGHALAGLAVGWCTIRDRNAAGARDTTLLIACVLAATLPDLDLLYSPWHRLATHGIGTSVLIFIVVVLVTGKVTGRGAWRVAAIVAVAHVSHILLDWLGADRRPPLGIQALWPFDTAFYISGWDLFLSTERRDPFSWATVLWNGRAAIRELLIMAPVAALAWGFRRIRKNPGLTSSRGDRPQPFAGEADTRGISDRQAPRAERPEWQDTRRGR